MTVKELIEILSEFDDDNNVIITDPASLMVEIPDEPFSRYINIMNFSTGLW